MALKAARLSLFKNTEIAPDLANLMARCTGGLRDIDIQPRLFFILNLI